MDGTTIMEWDLVPPDMECNDLFFTEASYNQFSEKVDFSKQTISKYLELGSYSFNNKDLTDKIDETISFAECLQDSEQMTGESAASADKDVIEKRSAENNNLVQISESQNTSVVETRSNCETPLTRSTPLLSEEQTQNTSYGRKRKQYPRCSSLKNSEQNFYVSKLMIYQKTKPDPKCPDYQKFLKLHKKVHKEQKDFMIFLKKASVEFKNDYAFLPKIAKKYMQEKHEAMLNRLEKHGPFYFPIEQVPIITKLYSKNVLQPVKILLQMGEVPVSFQFTNKNMKTILDYDVLQKKFPTDRIQQLNNNDALYSHQVCSEDKNALDLAVKYQCDIVVSSSVLKCLVDNHAPQFEKGWDIPVCVQEYKIEGEEKPTHKVVFLDKPFHRKPSSRSINTIFHKFSLAARLLHVNHMSKHSFQPSTTVQKHDVCNDQCSQDINSLDDLIDVSSLETFGTSVSNTEPKTIIGKQNPKKRNLSEISPRTKKRMESISEKKSPKENFVKELFSDSLEENSETIQDVNSSFHSKTILEVEEKSQTDLVFTCSSGNPLQSPDQKEPFSLSKENRNNIQQQNTFQDIDSNSLSCQEKNHEYKRQDSSLKELNETEIKLNVEKIQKQNPRISKTCDTKKGKEIYDMLTVEENGTKLEKHQPEEISTKPEENLLKEIGTISKENQTDGIDMEPEEKQSEGIDMEPEKKQSEGIDMESEEKQSEGIDMESEKKQSEGIDMESEKKQSEGIDMEPEKKQSEGIDMEPEKKQSEGIDMESEEKQSEGIDMESEKKQSEGIDMEPEKKQSEGIDMEPEKKQSEGIDMEPEKKQSEGIDMEPEEKQSEGIDMEPEKKQSEGIDMEPEKKQSEGIDMEPEEKQSEGIDMEPEEKQSEKISRKLEKNQSDGIGTKAANDVSEEINRKAIEHQSDGIIIEDKKKKDHIDTTPNNKEIQMEEDTDDDDDDSSSELVIHFESSDNEEDFQSETNQFLNKTEKSTCSPDRSKRKMTDSPQSLNSDLSPCPPECLASPTPDCPTSPTPDHPTSPTPDCPTSPTPDCPTSPTPDCPTSPTPECPASPTQQSPIPDCPASPLSEIQNSRSLSIQNDLLESFQKPMVIIPTESDGNVFDFCDIRTESPRNSVPPISRNAKRAIFPKKNHQRAFELGPLDNILEKQEELLKNTNKIKSTNKPAEMKCKNSPKKSINLETQENTEDFLAPKKGKNVTYCIWNLGDLRLLIRCKYSAVRKSKKSKEFVYLMPKLEYQIGFGYEQTTLSEASQMWISSLIRHNCIINRIRINAFSSLILMEEMLSFQQISQLYNPVAANSFLYNSFKKLSSLKPGSYCFSHSVGDNVSIISQAISKKSHHPSYSLKTLYPEYIVSDLPQEIPWVPLDTNMLMPFHKTHGRIPCTFNPSDQKGQKTNSKTKKKKKKKPKKK